jgi:proteasome lid subunit RPN8/RPN11
LAIRMNRKLLDAIKRHGEETYPKECCGFLLGTVEEGINRLKIAFPARNEWHDSPSDPAPAESQRNRYLITPEQWKQADAHARESGLGIIGYYHSHPDHPAAPSGYDLDHSCWPGESYIIVSIEHGKAGAINSFTKPDYTKFEKEEILLDQ